MRKIGVRIRKCTCCEGEREGEEKSGGEMHLEWLIELWRGRKFSGEDRKGYCRARVQLSTMGSSGERDRI
jgi:hypothetical protein